LTLHFIQRQQQELTAQLKQTDPGICVLMQIVDQGRQAIPQAGVRNRSLLKSRAKGLRNGTFGS
jgi:hypothetical protein